MSEEGTGSRLPWLPSESQENSAGGGPFDSIASSIIRRISASATTEITSLMWAGTRSARWSATTVKGRRPAASSSCSFVFASAIARRRTKGVCASAATTSIPTTTPSTSDRDERMGTWRTSLSSIASITSAPVCSAPTVTTGAVITSLIGASTGTPPTTTRERRSLSVTIPRLPSSLRTSTELAPSWPMCSAASRNGVSGVQITGFLRIRAHAGCCATSGPATSAPSAVPGLGRLSSDRAR
jgi:hypothetical protein